MARKRKPIVWVDKAGNPITKARVDSHVASIVGLIRSYFPSLRCSEASMEFEDIKSECELETMKSLVNWDPEASINSVTKFNDRKLKTDEEHLKWKQENREKHLLAAEGSWVRGRLVMYLWRLRYNNSEEQKGGRSQSFESILVKANKVLTFDGSEENIFSGTDFTIDSLDSSDTMFGREDLSLALINSEQAQNDIDWLLEGYTMSDAEGAKRFAEISKDSDRLDNLKTFSEMTERAVVHTSYGMDLKEAHEESESKEGKSEKSKEGTDDDSEDESF